MANRPTLPPKTVAEVLFRNRHGCCICRNTHKDVQIHHIDGNNDNNDLTNLAVICLDCHSKVTGIRGLGRSYSNLEVEKYKREWEESVRVQYGLPRAGIARKMTTSSRELMAHDVKRITYELMSLSDSNIAGIRTGFEKLWLLIVFEGMEDVVLRTLDHAVLLEAIGSVNKPVEMAKFLPKIFLHLIGPVQVPLTRNDRSRMESAVETLEIMHNLSVEENKRYKLLSTIRSSLGTFMQIAIDYRLNRLFAKARQVLQELNESSITKYSTRDRKLPKLSEEISEMKLGIKKELRKAKLTWKI